MQTNMLSLQADDIFVQLGAVALSLTLSGVGSRVFSCTSDILKSNCIDPKLCKLKRSAMMTHHDNKKTNLNLTHLLHTNLCLRKIPFLYLYCHQTSYWLFAGSLSHVLDVCHSFKEDTSPETAQWSFHWSRNLQCCKTASATLASWLPEPGHHVGPNECAVGWITISVA